MDTERGYTEVRDPCFGCSSAMDPGQPGSPPHHWGSDDAYSECVEWDLLWVEYNDVVITEMIVVSMQATIEP